VFSCVGPMPAAVFEGWRRIWQFFAETGAPCRAYTADFELYQSDTAPPDIWVAVLQTGS
jgi:predicted transcriptional regulator YdeE